MHIAQVNKLNFKGQYIINGRGKDVKAVHQNMQNHFCDKTNPAKDWYDVEYLDLLPITKYNTSECTYLYATNEHSKNIRNYYTAIEKVCEQDYENLILLLHEKTAQEKEAVKKLKSGYPDDFLDFIIEHKRDLKVQAQNMFDDYQKYSTINYKGTIQELDAEDVLEAMKNNSFDYVNGKITKK